MQGINDDVNKQWTINGPILFEFNMILNLDPNNMRI